jgi:hypothetical protein
MNFIKKVITDWFTGPDGKTHDPARFLWFLGVVSLLIYSGVDMFRHEKLDLEQFAFAYSGLLAAGAAGVKIKESTEPKAPVDPTTPIPPAQKVVQVNVNTNDDDDDLPRPPKG